MTPDELRMALEQAAPLDAAAATSMAGRVRAETLALPARVVELSIGAPDALARKARMLAARLEELAAPALLDARQPPDASAAVWMLSTATAAAVGLRARLAARLRPMLDDRRLLPPAGPADPRVEEPERARRVCDEAYAMLRELLHTDEGRTAFLMDRWAFLRLPEPERDAEIARAAAGQPFARLLDDQEA